MTILKQDAPQSGAQPSLFGNAPVGSVLLGDGIAELARLEPGSVDLLLSDLPSGATRHAYDKRPDLSAFWEATWSALRADGAAVLMASSMVFANALVASQPTRFRYDMIWHKSLATGFLNARKRPLRAHEFILVFSRAEPPYIPQMLTGATPIHDARRASHGANYGAMSKATRTRLGAVDRYPVSVLPFASVGTSSRERVHPQQKPVDLLRYLLRTYSRQGGLVVDPFAGSGSTGEACAIEGRRFRGWDLNPKFGADIPPDRPGRKPCGCTSFANCPECSYSAPGSR